MAGLNTYATLTDFRTRFGLAATDTLDDARLLAKLRQATTQIERYTARQFAPYVATRKFDYFSARTLLFRGGDLLELTALLNGDGSTIDPAAIILLGGVNGPYFGLELDVTKAFFVYQTTKLRALSVSGVWGWHDDYLNAGWRPSGDAVTTFGLSSSGTALTVTNAASADPWNLSPRFQIGQLLRIDQEYMHVIDVNSGTNTLTIVRGANGSTPVAHAVSTPIFVYAPPPDLVQITLRWAAWLFRQEESGDYNGQAAEPAAVGLKIKMNGVPPDLVQELEPLRHIGGAT